MVICPLGLLMGNCVVYLGETSGEYTEMAIARATSGML